MADKPRIIEVPLYIDDRGTVYGAFDKMHEFGIKRTYVVENHAANFLRAWHGHRKAATYIHVISGVAMVAAANMDNHDDYFIATLSAQKPSLLYVPPGYYNGAKNLVTGTRLLVYSTVTMDEVKNDNFRLKWNEIHPEMWEVQPR